MTNTPQSQQTANPWSFAALLLTFGLRIFLKNIYGDPSHLLFLLFSCSFILTTLGILISHPNEQQALNVTRNIIDDMVVCFRISGFLVPILFLFSVSSFFDARWGGASLFIFILIIGLCWTVILFCSAYYHSLLKLLAQRRKTTTNFLRLALATALIMGFVALIKDYIWLSEFYSSDISFPSFRFRGTKPREISYPAPVVSVSPAGQPSPLANESKRSKPRPVVVKASNPTWVCSDIVDVKNLSETQLDKHFKKMISAFSAFRKQSIQDVEIEKRNRIDLGKNEAPIFFLDTICFRLENGGKNRYFERFAFSENSLILLEEICLEVEEDYRPEWKIDDMNVVGDLRKELLYISKNSSEGGWSEELKVVGRRFSKQSFCLLGAVMLEEVGDFCSGKPTLGVVCLHKAWMSRGDENDKTFVLTRQKGEVNRNFSPKTPEFWKTKRIVKDTFSWTKNGLELDSSINVQGSRYETETGTHLAN